MIKVTIVLVLYNCILEESLTFQTLKNHLDIFHKLKIAYEFIIYDNSLASLGIADCAEFNIKYIHDSRNLGIATAYNYALNIGIENGSKWILLLDQDTEITCEYVSEILFNCKTLQEEVAIVPRIISNKKIVSPMFQYGLRVEMIDLEKLSTSEKDEKCLMTCINSGAMININFLEKIGGFNEKEFPLDFLDFWLFLQIHQLKAKVYILKSTLSHNLSVSDYNSLSLKRYMSILNSEILFVTKYRREQLGKYKSRLFIRFFKQLFLVKNKKIAYYTLSKRMEM